MGHNPRQPAVIDPAGVGGGPGDLEVLSTTSATESAIPQCAQWPVAAEAGRKVPAGERREPVPVTIRSCAIANTE